MRVLHNTSLVCRISRIIPLHGVTAATSRVDNPPIHQHCPCLCLATWSTFRKDFIIDFFPDVAISPVLSAQTLRVTGTTNLYFSHAIKLAGSGGESIQPYPIQLTVPGWICRDSGVSRGSSALCERGRRWINGCLLCVKNIEKTDDRWPNGPRALQQIMLLREHSSENIY